MANAGYKALVQIGGTPATITNLTSAEIQIGVDIYDITDLGAAGWKKKLAGIADYTLKLAGNLDLTDAQQTALQAAAITTPGAAVSWQILPIGTGSKYSGSALLKTMSPKFDVKSQQTVDFELEGNGAIAYA